jgi:hypothetical protein
MRQLLCAVSATKICNGWAHSWAAGVSRFLRDSEGLKLLASDSVPVPPKQTSPNADRADIRGAMNVSRLDRRTTPTVKVYRPVLARQQK